MSSKKIIPSYATHIVVNYYDYGRDLQHPRRLQRQELLCNNGGIPSDTLRRMSQ
jgi:hypothetical protein